MKQNKIIVGITGGSGSGKSTVSKLLEQKGCLAVDADQVAKQVVEPGQPALSEIFLEYGQGVMRKDGGLDRKRLAAIVFANHAKLARLNEITHKYVIDEINKIIAATDKEIVLIDAIGLYEAGIDKDCDYIIAVICDRDLRMKRIMERDSLTLKEAKDRINAQKDDAYYTQRADFVILNEGRDLSPKVLEIYLKIKGD